MSLSADEPEGSQLLRRWSSRRAQASSLSTFEEGKVTPPKYILVVGPSGVGKGCLVNALCSEFSEYVRVSVSHTTRPPRRGEVDGVHYQFVTRDAMLKAIERGEFIESVEFAGNLYGTSIAAVKKAASGKSVCLIEIDLEGCKNVIDSELGQGCVTIFVNPPCINSLRQRLIGRGTENEETVKDRIDTANRELTEKIQFDFTYEILNEDFDACYSELRSIFLTEFDRLFPKPSP